MPKFTISRSIEIDAPVSKVFDVVIDFDQEHFWSPWTHTEPDHFRETVGDPTQVGSMSRWEGSRVGAGEMEHKEIRKNEYILSELRFTKPWKSTDSTSFEFEKLAADKTRVTWDMHASLPFFMGFMKKMMIAMIGENYDRGLQMLKQYVETGEVHTKTEFLGVEEQDGFSYVGIERQCPIPDMPDLMTKDFTQLIEKTKDLKMTGYPLSIYKKFDMVKQYCHYIAAVPVEAGQSAPDSFVSGKIEPSKVIKVRHTGDYKYLGNMWSMGIGEARSKKMKMNKGLLGWEVYPNDPAETAPKDCIVELSVPIK